MEIVAQLLPRHFPIFLIFNFAQQYPFGLAMRYGCTLSSLDLDHPFLYFSWFFTNSWIQSSDLLSFNRILNIGGATLPHLHIGDRCPFYPQCFNLNQFNTIVFSQVLLPSSKSMNLAPALASFLHFLLKLSTPTKLGTLITSLSPVKPYPTVFCSPW